MADLSQTDSVIVVNSSQSQDLLQMKSSTDKSSDAELKASKVPITRRSSRRLSVRFPGAETPVQTSQDSENVGKPVRSLRRVEPILVNSSSTSSGEQVSCQGDLETCPSVPPDELNIMAGEGEKVVDTLSSDTSLSTGEEQGAKGARMRDSSVSVTVPAKPCAPRYLSEPTSSAKETGKAKSTLSVSPETLPSQPQESDKLALEDLKGAGVSSYTSLIRWLKKAQPGESQKGNVDCSSTEGDEGKEHCQGAPSPAASSLTLVEETQSPKEYSGEGNSVNRLIPETPTKSSLREHPLPVKDAATSEKTGDSAVSVKEKPQVMPLVISPSAELWKDQSPELSPTPSNEEHGWQSRFGLNPPVFCDEVASQGFPVDTEEQNSFCPVQESPEPNKTEAKARDTHNRTPHVHEDRAVDHNHHNLFGFIELLNEADATSSVKPCVSVTASGTDNADKASNSHTSSSDAEGFDLHFSTMRQTPPHCRSEFHLHATEMSDVDSSQATSESSSTQDSAQKSQESLPTNSESSFDPTKEATLSDMSEHAKKRKQRTPKKITDPQMLRRTPRKKVEKVLTCACCSGKTSTHRHSTSQDSTRKPCKRSWNKRSPSDVGSPVRKRTRRSLSESVLQGEQVSMVQKDTALKQVGDEGQSPKAGETGDGLSPQDVGEKTPEMKTSSTPLRQSTTKRKREVARRRSLRPVLNKMPDSDMANDSPLKSKTVDRSLLISDSAITSLSICDTADTFLSEPNSSDTSLTKCDTKSDILSKKSSLQQEDKNSKTVDRQKTDDIKGLTERRLDICSQHSKVSKDKTPPKMVTSRKRLKKLSWQMMRKVVRSPPKLRLRKKKGDASKLDETPKDSLNDKDKDVIPSPAFVCEQSIPLREGMETSESEASILDSGRKARLRRVKLIRIDITEMKNTKRLVDSMDDALLSGNRTSRSKGTVSKSETNYSDSDIKATESTLTSEHERKDGKLQTTEKVISRGGDTKNVDCEVPSLSALSNQTVMDQSGEEPIVKRKRGRLSPLASTILRSGRALNSRRLMTLRRLRERPTRLGNKKKERSQGKAQSAKTNREKADCGIGVIDYSDSRHLTTESQPAEHQLTDELPQESTRSHTGDSTLHGSDCGAQKSEGPDSPQFIESTREMCAADLETDSRPSILEMDKDEFTESNNNAIVVVPDTEDMEIEKENAPSRPSNVGEDMQMDMQESGDLFENSLRKTTFVTEEHHSLEQNSCNAPFAMTTYPEKDPHQNNQSDDFEEVESAAIEQASDLACEAKQLERSNSMNLTDDDGKEIACVDEAEGMLKDREVPSHRQKDGCAAKISLHVDGVEKVVSGSDVYTDEQKDFPDDEQQSNSSVKIYSPVLEKMPSEPKTDACAEIEMPCLEKQSVHKEADCDSGKNISSFEEHVEQEPYSAVIEDSISDKVPSKDGMWSGSGQDIPCFEQCPEEQEIESRQKYSDTETVNSSTTENEDPCDAVVNNLRSGPEFPSEVSPAKLSQENVKITEPDASVCESEEMSEPGFAPGSPQNVLEALEHREKEDSEPLEDSAYEHFPDNQAGLEEEQGEASPAVVDDGTVQESACHEGSEGKGVSMSDVTDSSSEPSTCASGDADEDIDSPGPQESMEAGEAPPAARKRWGTFTSPRRLKRRRISKHELFDLIDQSDATPEEIIAYVRSKKKAKTAKARLFPTRVSSSLQSVAEPYGRGMAMLQHSLSKGRQQAGKDRTSSPSRTELGPFAFHVSSPSRSGDTLSAMMASVTASPSADASPSASPGGSILKWPWKSKPADGEVLGDILQTPTPSKRRRVSFADPIISGESPAHEATLTKMPNYFVDRPLKSVQSKRTKTDKKSDKPLTLVLSRSKAEEAEAPAEMQPVSGACQPKDPDPSANEAACLSTEAKTPSGSAPSQEDSENQCVDLPSQNSYHSTQESQLDSARPVFPDLISCTDPVTLLLSKLTSTMWCRGLEVLMKSLGVHTVGDLASLSEVKVHTLPILAPKVQLLTTVLANYHARSNPSRPTAVDNGESVNQPQPEIQLQGGSEEVC